MSKSGTFSSYQVIETQVKLAKANKDFVDLGNRKDRCNFESKLDPNAHNSRLTLYLNTSPLCSRGWPYPQQILFTC